LPGYAVTDNFARRSHAAVFILKDVNKPIDLLALKSYNAAGVTPCGEEPPARSGEQRLALARRSGIGFAW
jgi:hypothetical protein